jgi:hypothetical protein
MRMLLFKFFFRITWWIAPCRERVDQLFRIYGHLLEMEEQKKICEERQREMDKCIRPRTETGEQHTISDSANRRHYTDYDEATAYHEGKKIE